MFSHRGSLFHWCIIVALSLLFRGRIAATSPSSRQPTISRGPFINLIDRFTGHSTVTFWNHSPIQPSVLIVNTTNLSISIASFFPCRQSQLGLLMAYSILDAFRISNAFRCSCLNVYWKLTPTQPWACRTWNLVYNWNKERCGDPAPGVHA